MIISIFPCEKSSHSEIYIEEDTAWKLQLPSEYHECICQPVRQVCCQTTKLPGWKHIELWAELAFTHPPTYPLKHSSSKQVIRTNSSTLFLTAIKSISCFRVNKVAKAGMMDRFSTTNPKAEIFFRACSARFI